MISPSISPASSSPSSSNSSSPISLSPSNSFSETTLESLERVAHRYRQLEAITAIAFAALGLALIAFGIATCTTVPETSIIAIFSFCCFSLAYTMGYLPLEHLLRSFRSEQPTPALLPYAVPSLPGELDLSPKKHSADARLISLRNKPRSLLEMTSEELNEYYRALLAVSTLNTLMGKSYFSDSYRLNLKPALKGVEIVTSAGKVRQRRGNTSTKISVKNKSCLTVAQELVSKGSNPLLLIPAQSDSPPDYIASLSPLEEQCYIQTALAAILDKNLGRQTRDFFHFNQNAPHAGIYAPHVPLFLDSNGNFLAEGIVKIACGVITPVKKNEAQNLMRERIRTLLHMAYSHKHRSVVVNDFGCHPPHQYSAAEIAKLMMDVIVEEFSSCFEEVIFAIADYNDSFDNFEGTSVANFPFFVEQARDARQKMVSQLIRNHTPPLLLSESSLNF